MTFKVIRGQGQAEEMTSFPYWDYFYACCLWLWLRRPLVALRCVVYFRFCGWRFSYHGANGPEWSTRLYLWRSSQGGGTSWTSDNYSSSEFRMRHRGQNLLSTISLSYHSQYQRFSIFLNAQSVNSIATVEFLIASCMLFLILPYEVVGLSILICKRKSSHSHLMHSKSKEPIHATCNVCR